MGEQAAMPTFAYAIIGGVALIFLILVPIMIKKQMGKAKQGGQDMMATLARVGLQVSSQEGAVVRLDGHWRGRRIAMKSDGSAVMKAGKKAMRGSLMGAAKELGGMGGIGGGTGGDDWKAERKTKRLQRGMQNAAMVIRWAVVLPLESPVRVTITPDDEEGGQELAKGVYGTFDEGARTGLSNPNVLQAIAATNFDVITIEGTKVMCVWAPPMREYQKIAASSEAYAQVTERAINTLCDLCDAFYGPAQAAAA